MTPAPPSPAEPGPRPEGVLLGLALAYFAAYQLFKLPVVLPVLLERYQYDRALAGGFMSVYALAGLCLSFWLGKLIGRRGPLYLATPALICISGGAAIALIAPQHGLVVLASRTLEGAAFAVFAIIGPVLMSVNAPPRQLPIILGLSATWIPVGQLTAALLAPAALATVGWQLMWYVAIAASVVLFFWCDRFRRGATFNDAPGSETDAIVFTASQRTALVLVAAVFMLWSSQYFAYMTWLPQYLVEVHQLGVTSALLGYLIPVSLVMIFCVLTGVVLRLGWPVGWLMSAAVLSQVIVWWSLPFTGAGYSGLLSLVAYGVGAGIVPACLFAMPNAVLGPGKGVADAFGIVMTGRNLGVLIGPVLLAQAFKISGTWDLATPVFGTLTAVCLGTALVLAFLVHR